MARLWKMYRGKFYWLAEHGFPTKAAAEAERKKYHKIKNDPE